MKHLGTKTIETERLILRRVAMTDAEMMFRNWTSDERVVKFLRWGAHRTLNETETMIQGWLERYHLENTYYWGIYLKEGEMIGSTGVTILSEEEETGELGYKLGSRWWNRGYATEAVKAVLDFMFHEVQIKRISAYLAVENKASEMVLRKAGLMLEDRREQYYETPAGKWDCVFYAITDAGHRKLSEK